MVASALRLGARYQRRNHGLEPAWGILRSTSEREGIWGHPFMTSTRREEGVRLRWTHVDGGGGPAPCGHPHRKLKLESTDVIGLGYCLLLMQRSWRLFYQN